MLRVLLLAITLSSWELIAGEGYYRSLCGIFLTNLVKSWAIIAIFAFPVWI